MNKGFKRGMSVLVASAAVISQGTAYGSYVDAASASDKLNIERLGGENRFETSIEVSKKTFKTSEYVVIASGNNFPDAISAGSIAGFLKAPILLSDIKGSNDRIIKEVKRLGAKEVIVVGGVNSVGEELLNTLKSSTKVTRIAGNDRYMTSVGVARELKAKGSSFKEIYFANGNGFADALTISSLAAKSGAPVILTDGKSLPNGISALDGFESMRKILAGGPASISIEGIRAERLGGKDRYDTARIIAEKGFKNYSGAVLADGRNFPDALCAISVSSSMNAPILLSNNNSKDSNLKYINSKNLDKLVIVGGEGSISESTVELYKKGITGIGNQSKDSDKDNKDNKDNTNKNNGSSTSGSSSSGTNKPSTGGSGSGSGSTTPGTGNVTPGTGNSNPGTGNVMPGTGTSNPGTNDKPEAPSTDDGIKSIGAAMPNYGVYVISDSDSSDSNALIEKAAEKLGVAKDKIYAVKGESTKGVVVVLGEGLQTKALSTDISIPAGIYRSNSSNELVSESSCEEGAGIADAIRGGIRSIARAVTAEDVVEVTLFAGEISKNSPVEVGKIAIGMPGANTIKNAITISKDTRLVEGLSFSVENTPQEALADKAVISNRGTVKDLNTDLVISNNKVDFGNSSKFANLGVNLYGAQKGFIRIINNTFTGLNKGESLDRVNEGAGIIRIVNKSMPDTLIEIKNNNIERSEYHGILAMHSPDASLSISNNNLNEIGQEGIRISVFGNPKDTTITGNTIKSYGTREILRGAFGSSTKTEKADFETGINLDFIDPVYGISFNSTYYDNKNKLSDSIMTQNKVTPAEKNNEHPHVLDSHAINVGRAYTFMESSSEINKKNKLSKYDVTIVKDEDGDNIYGQIPNKPDRKTTVKSLRILGDGSGTITLPSNLIIEGDLIIDAPNAVLKNNATVNGKIIIKRIKSEDKSSFKVSDEISIVKRNASAEGVSIDITELKSKSGAGVSAESSSLDSGIELSYMSGGSRKVVEKGRDYRFSDSNDRITLTKAFLDSLDDDTSINIKISDSKSSITEVTKLVSIKLSDKTKGVIVPVEGEVLSFYHKNATKPIKLRIKDVVNMAGESLSPAQTVLKGHVKVTGVLLKHNDANIEIDDENDIITLKPEFLNQVRATRFTSSDQVGLGSSGEIRVVYEDLDNKVGEITGKVRLEVINESSVKIELASSKTFVQGRAPKNGIKIKISDIKDALGRPVSLSEVDFNDAIGIESFPFDWKHEVDPDSAQPRFNRNLYTIDPKEGTITLKKEYLDKLNAQGDKDTEEGIKQYTITFYDEARGIDYRSKKISIHIKKPEANLNSDAAISARDESYIVGDADISSGKLKLNANTSVGTVLSNIVGSNPRIVKRIYPKEMVVNGDVSAENIYKYKRDYMDLAEGDKLVVTAEDGVTKRVYNLILEATSADRLLKGVEKGFIVESYGNTYIELKMAMPISSVLPKLKLAENTRAEFYNGSQKLEDSYRLQGGETLKISNDTISESREVRILSRPKYRALIVGNSDYQGEKLDLRGPRNDVNIMRDVFKKNSPGGVKFKSKDITVKENLKKQEFIQALREAFKDAKDNDVSYLYYSGHGNNLDNMSYICTVDGFHQGSTPEETKKSMTSAWISVDELHDELEKIKGTKVLIFDSCNSGGFIGKDAVDAITSPTVSNPGAGDSDLDELDGLDSLDRGVVNINGNMDRNARRASDKNSGKTYAVRVDKSKKENAKIERIELERFNDNIAKAFDLKPMSRSSRGYLTGNKYKVLTAASANEYSYEDLSDEVGKFTKQLAQAGGYDKGILKADDNSDNKVSLDELYNYLMNNVEYTSHIQAYPRGDSFTIFEISKKTVGFGDDTSVNPTDPSTGGDPGSTVVPKPKKDPDFGDKFIVDYVKKTISSGTLRLNSETTAQQLLDSLIKNPDYSYILDREYEPLEGNQKLMNGDVLVVTNMKVGGFPKRYKLIFE